MTAEALLPLLKRVGKQGDAASATSDGIHGKLAEVIARLGAEGDAASMAGSLHAKLEALNNELSNGTYGLAAIKAYVDSIEGELGSGTYGLAAIKAYVDGVEGELTSGVHGLAVIKAYVDGVEGELTSGVHGLAVIKAYVDGVEGELANGTYGLAALDTDLNTLLTRATEARLGRLDADVSSRLAAASYTAPDNGSIGTILGRTDVATSTRKRRVSTVVVGNSSGSTSGAWETIVNRSGVAGHVDRVVLYGSGSEAKVRFTVDGQGPYYAKSPDANANASVVGLPYHTSDNGNNPEAMVGNPYSRCVIEYRSSIIIEKSTNNGGADVKWVLREE